MSEITTSSYFAKLLRLSGIERVYVYPGGTIAPLIASLEEEGIQLVVFRSEQGAGFAAVGDARTTGKLAVVLVSSGPGVTNVLTPLADAFYDSVPILVIAGQVSSADLNSGRVVRQKGFQETPTIALTSPISKFAAQVIVEGDADRTLRRAIEEAISPRPGPSVIDLPIDVQRAPSRAEPNTAVNIEWDTNADKCDYRVDLEDPGLITALQSSRRRLVLLGQGARNGLSLSQIAQFVEKHEFMVVTSFMGVGVFDSESELSLGYVGHTGHAAANFAVASCDFLLVLGSRLDVRQTGTETQVFAPSATICWVDFDETELKNPRIKSDFTFLSSVSFFLDKLDSKFHEISSADSDRGWRNELQEMKRASVEDAYSKSSEVVSPRLLLEKLKSVIRDMRPIVVTGVGLHQHWVARHLNFGPHSAHLISSGGHGTMGFDIPVAIGAKISNPHRPVICIVGDGSAYMNIQELGLVHDEAIDVRFIVVNNGKLGIVSQFQKFNWGKDPTTGRFGGVSLAAIAAGFGLHSMRISKPDEIEGALSWLMEGDCSRFLEVVIDSNAVISPMLLAGQRMDDMWFEGESNVRA